VSVDVVATVLDAICAALPDRAGLAGVNVYSAPVSTDDAGTEYIVFGNPKLETVRGGAAGYRAETWRVEGELRAWKPWAGSIELTIKAARDRALALFGELDAHVNDTYADGLPSVTVASGDLDQDHQSEDRACWLAFVMFVETVGDSQDSEPEAVN
jgi:hypothetical protein